MALVVQFPNVYSNSFHATWQFLLCAAGPCLLIAAVTRQGLLRMFFSSNVLVQLGRISYGLYVYHIIGLVVMSRLFLRWNGLQLADSDVTIWLEQVGLGLSLTIVIAWLSYNLYERHFLRLKERFASVESRPI